MRISRYLFAIGLTVASAAKASAQDQTIIIDQPLQACGSASHFALSGFDETKAREAIAAALGKGHPDASTYYIIHATEFVPGRMVVAAEDWFVYHQPWHQRPAFWWLGDSRAAKRFRETRVLGSSRVALVYLYANVPVFESRSVIDQLGKFFRGRLERADAEEDKAAAEEVAKAKEFSTEAVRTAEVARRRTERRRQQRQTLEDKLPASAEQDALKRAGAAGDLELNAWLETELFLKGLAEQKTNNELAIINRDNGEALTGLSPTLSTADTYKSLAQLYYRIDVTAKVPAPIQNLKEAAKLGFGLQSDASLRLGVALNPATVCAGRAVRIDHIPSDLNVKALVGATGNNSPTERTKQLFDNEGRYWWDVSFALPANLRRDVTIDVDAGQVAAKEVEKTDLFAVVNLGAPRDTKKIQWQIIPTFVYGMPITGKPLKHHLVGFSVGLNYVQLIGGFRFDRRQQISTTTENGTTVGVEGTPPGEKWERTWVWGINIPVKTVVKILSK